MSTEKGPYTSMVNDGETVVMVVVQKPGDEGAAYTLRLPDGREVTIGDGTTDYWNLAAVIEDTFDEANSRRRERALSYRQRSRSVTRWED